MDSAPIFRSVQLSSPLTSRLMTAVGTSESTIVIQMLHTCCVCVCAASMKCGLHQSLLIVTVKPELQNRLRDTQRVLTKLRLNIFDWKNTRKSVFGEVGAASSCVLSGDGTGIKHKGSRVRRLKLDLMRTIPTIQSPERRLSVHHVSFHICAHIYLDLARGWSAPPAGETPTRVFEITNRLLNHN